jgi:magnesium chelatase subunit D
MAVFPFCAVRGQERLKLALLLCAIDPGIGGVLVRGPRGVAKTTLARAFSQLLPGRFVELPLGATEERVSGSLDLGKALGQGQVEFSPGLLARAHEGVLYVDEVNLLPDALVDLLLDAAATGQNVVERDGLSHVHPARFVLIGTMNPDEGELRPQLCDRFGLSVVAESVLGPNERSQVVLRRLEFERDPELFVAAYGVEQAAVLERCRAARRRVHELPFAGPGVAHAAELCHAAQVDGVRADLAMLRAARAHAAWHDRAEILPADVDAVAEFALAHRRRGPSPGAGGRGGQSSGGERSGGGGSGGGDRSGGGDIGRDPAKAGGARPGSRSLERGERPSDASAGTAGSPGDASAPGSLGARPEALSAAPDRGKLEPVPVRSGAPPLLPRWFLHATQPDRHARTIDPRRSAPRAATAPRLARQRRRRGAHPLGDGAIDWFATLLHVSRSQGSEQRVPTAADVKRRPRRLAWGSRCVLALDCSASMLQSGALAAAKAVAHALAQRAASVSTRLTLVSFGGLDVNESAATENERAAVERAIAALGAAGGTPLRRAVQVGLETASRAERGALDRRLLLFTDGRTRERVEDLAANHPGVAVTVIDCERGTVRLGRAQRIAEALQGRYVHIDWLADTSAAPAVDSARPPVPGLRR